MKNLIIFFLVPLLLLGCDSEEEEPCGTGISMEVGGEKMCVFRQEVVIENGFSCPAEFALLSQGAGLGVCAGSTNIIDFFDEIRQKFRERDPVYEGCSKNFHCTTNNICRSDFCETREIESPESLVATEWGFKEFKFPSKTIRLEAGDDLQEGINQLGEGGAIKLGSGVFEISSSTFVRSNLIIEGEGSDRTTLRYAGPKDPSNPVRVIGVAESGIENVIVRDLKIDASDAGDTHAIDMIKGVKNVLLENLDVSGSVRSPISFFGLEEDRISQITIRNVSASDNSGRYQSGISLRFVDEALIENATIENIPDSAGLSLFGSTFVELSNIDVKGAAQGLAFSRSDYLYLHDSKVSDIIGFDDAASVVMNVLRGEGGMINAHFERLQFSNSDISIVDYGNGENYPMPTFDFLILNDINLTNIGVDGDHFRIRGVQNLYEYGNTKDKTLSKDGGTIERKTSSTSPTDDGVGYTSWAP